MKRIALAVIVCIIGSAVAFGQAQEEMTQEEKNLEILSKKLVRMKREMDKFVKEMSVAYQQDGTPGISSFGSDVRVDVAENTNDFVVKADLPGMDKDKIIVTLDNNRLLKISGTREMVRQEKGPNLVRSERMEGRFERVIELPAECRPDGIRASYTNGVLEIIIPKKQPSKAETVKVKIQ